MKFQQREPLSDAKATAMVIGMAIPVLLGLPLLGVAIADKPIDAYLEFPPLTHFVEHAPFSWIGFALMSACIAACVLPFIVTIRRSPLHAHVIPHATFPIWGMAGIVLTLVAWVIAWTRLPWLAPVQAYTFIPLWLGYIVTVNAVSMRVSGRSPLTHETRVYLLLFPVSALFWWFFEYLNRFVQNWYYVGIDTFAPLEYALWASLAFSTVLPAVYATHSLLTACPRLYAGLDRVWCLRLPPRCVSPALLLAAAGLLAIGIWPNWTYPMLWLAPFAIIVLSQILLGQSTILTPIERGDWREF